ncbi:Dihydrosphingosine 1-phosphate phosphatase [Erysiphe necator]|nr:Dihydrosphingosine 1-phosphate phosphatase [Erysiphe necator]
MVLKQLKSYNRHSKDANFPKINHESSSSLSSSELLGIEAGLHSSEYYKRILSPWRFRLRQNIIPLIQWETPYLAWLQNKIRMPILDSYFAITANLGTHTFFMVILPILFWCGYTSLGRSMVHILANGVFLTGLLKDLLSLPRPLTPPLHRITMSKSASSEYGFPSTHSANAASVASYALITLYTLEYKPEGLKKVLIWGIACLYVFTIIIGRLYCGMHGFIDVSVGGVIGVIISIYECAYGPAINKFMFQSSWVAPATVALIMLILILIHPEPADECPCFDDTIAFAGVVIGIEAGGWHYANSDWAWNSPVPATVPFDLRQMGWVVAALRVTVGIIFIFAWRKIIKMVLLKYLPLLFSKVDDYGLIIYQNYSKLSSLIKSIAPYLKLGSIGSIIYDLSDSFTSVHNLINRFSTNERGKPSIQVNDSLKGSELNHQDSENCNKRCEGLIFQCSSSEIKNHTSLDQTLIREPAIIQGLEAPELFSKLVQSTTKLKPASSTKISCEQNESHDRQRRAKDEEVSTRSAPFRGCNADIITKLIVYTGIGWLSVEINPIIFEMIGLGIGRGGVPSLYI